MHLFGVEVPDSLIPVAFVMFVGLLAWMVREQGKMSTKVSEMRAEFRERVANLEKKIDALEAPRSRNRRDRRDDA